MIKRKVTNRRTRKLNQRALNQRAARRSRLNLSLECLERRHMLTGIGLNIVEVQGTEDADDIFVFVADGRFVVEVNGASTSMNNEFVDGLYVEAKGGDDRVRIDISVLQSTLIFGGRGNDTILGGAGCDIILGGSGDDTIYGNVDNDILLGDGPNSLAEVPLPEPGDPGLATAANAQVIIDLVPVDPSDPDEDPLALQKYLSRISGINSGSDTIIGGTGHDMIFAGAHDDNVTGDGPDVPPGSVPPVGILELAIDDGASGPNVLVAEPEIVPPPANDYIEGGTGNDVVNSGPGNDLVFGGDGNDILTTGTGADNVVGGSGDDMIFSGSGRDHVLGDGPNTINQAILDADDIYFVNSALGTGNDTIEGGAGNDEVYAGDSMGSGVNLVFGGSGNDTIFGGHGRDAIVGGAGNDTIHSGAADDIVLGDSVNSWSDLPLPQPGEPADIDLTADTLHVTHIAPIDPTLPDPFALHKYLSRISGINFGSDTIVAGSGNDLVFAGALDDSVEGDGVDVYPVAVPLPTADGTPASDDEFGDIISPSYNDYIEAGSGNDHVDGGYGHNCILGGQGADTLISGAGGDIIVGGSGDDKIFSGGGPDHVLGDGPNNINQAIFDAADFYLVNSVLGAGNDLIEAGAGNDQVYTGDTSGFFGEFSG